MNGDRCRFLLALPIPLDQRVGRAIVLQLARPFELAQNPRRQHLAQLHAPLVERIDIPDRALGKDRVFIQRHQLTQNRGRQHLRQDRVRRPVALKDLVRDQLGSHALGLHLLGGLAEGQRLGLGKHVGHQHVVMASERIQRLGKADEVTWNQPRTLMDQLVERVLAVGAGLAPVDRTGLIVHVLAGHRDMLAVRLHRELLQIGRKPLQVLFIRQDRHRLGVEEVRIPDRQQAQQHRQVLLERRRLEVHVHRVEAGQQLIEVIRADRDHRRKPDRRIHRVASADPVPKAEHILGIDAEFRDFVWRSSKPRRSAWPRPTRRRQARPTVHARAELALVIVSSVVKVFDDTMKSGLVGWIEVAHGLDEIRAVDVRDEAEGQVAAGVMPQRLIRHHRAKVRAADADIDHIFDLLARKTLPLARADLLGESGHLFEHRMHLRHHILAVDDDLFRLRRPQRHVQHRAVFGDVDLVAAEHGIDLLAQTRLFGELDQQLQRLVGHPVLRVVEKDAAGLGGQALAPAGVGGEQIAQGGRADLLEVSLKRLPGLAFRQWCQLSLHTRFTLLESISGPVQFRELRASVGEREKNLAASAPD